jgi:ankyrin repeat protein
MTDTVPLLALVVGAIEICGTTSEALVNLGKTVSTDRASLVPISAECLTTQAALKKLECLLRETSPTAAATQKAELNECFELLVQSISTTIIDVDHEIRRLWRYSNSGDPLAASKFVPVLQDAFVEMSYNLRKDRSSLCLMLDCLESGNLSYAAIQLGDGSSIINEKLRDLSRPHPQVAVGLRRYSEKPSVQSLLAKFGTRNMRSPKTDPKVMRKLHQAIDNCDYNTVHKCLANKADPNEPARNSTTTPLFRALDQAEQCVASDDATVSRNSVSIVTALILAGADLRAVDQDGRTPLTRAVKGDMTDSLVTLMLERGAEVNATDSQTNTALHYAAMTAPLEELKNLELIRILLSFGAEQGIRNERGRTPLYKAVLLGHYDRARQLLDYGADLEVLDNNGWTALFAAVTQGNAALTRLLCDRGASANKRDKSGMSPLQHALTQGSSDVVQTLLETGADVNLICKGETPLCRATAKSNLPLIELLLENEADASLPSPGYCGALPIHLAAIGKSVEIVEVLVKAGSPLNASDDEGRTPLSWAMDGGKPELVQFFRNHGAS